MQIKKGMSDFMSIKKWFRRERKRVTAFTLALVMVLTTIGTDVGTIVAQAAEQASVGSVIAFEGAGTPENPYLVKGEAGLRALAHNIEVEAYYSAGKYFKVVNDLGDGASLYISDQGENTIVLGDHTDPEKYFYGTIDFDHVHIVSNRPLFDAVGNGAHIKNGNFFVYDRYSDNPEDFATEDQEVELPQEPEGDGSVSDGNAAIIVADGAVSSGNVAISVDSGSVSDGNNTDSSEGNGDAGDNSVSSGDSTQIKIPKNIESLEEDWGGLVRYVIAAPLSDKVGSQEITFENVELSAILKAYGEEIAQVSVGGLIGTVINRPDYAPVTQETPEDKVNNGEEDQEEPRESYALQVNLRGNKLQSDLSADREIDAKAASVGGVIGSLDNGEVLHEGDKQGHSNPIKVVLEAMPDDVALTNMQGVAVSTCGKLNGSQNVGGIIGQMNLGTSLWMNDQVAVNTPDTITGAKRGLYVGAANQALIVAGQEMALFLQDTICMKTPQADLYGAALDIKPVNDGTVYEKAVLDAVTIRRNNDGSYSINDGRQLVLLAAAINTMNVELLRKINPEVNAALEDIYAAKNALRTQLLSGRFVIDEDVTLEAKGFRGIGYYVDEAHYVGFYGTFSGIDKGNGEYTGVAFDLDTREENVGLFTLLYGVNEPARIENLTFSGQIQTTASGVGAVTAMIGHAGQKRNAGVILENISSSVRVESAAAGNGNVGSLIGFGDFSGITSGTNVSVVLRNITVTEDSSVTFAGAEAGGIIGSVTGMSQVNAEPNHGLRLQFTNIDYNGTLTGRGKYVFAAGGIIGAVHTRNDDFEGHSNISGLMPAAALELRYDTTMITAENVKLGGSFDTAAESTGGFAAILSGVTGTFEGLTIGSAMTVSGGFAGIAQTAQGKFTLGQVDISDTWKVTYEENAGKYPSGVLFGDAVKAWIHVDADKLTMGAAAAVSGAAGVDAHPAYDFIAGSNVTYKEAKYVVQDYLSGGIVNIENAENYTLDIPGTLKTGGTSTVTRYYFGLQNALQTLKPVDEENTENRGILGAGTTQEPFEIDTPQKLQVLSLLNYVSGSMAWRLLEYFPQAAYPANATNTDKIMYLKTAHYQFVGEIDLGSQSVYPMSVIGGSYRGVEGGDAGIVFHGLTPAQNTYTSAVKDHQAGLFTTINIRNISESILISDLTVKGTIVGSGIPGAIASGTALSETEAYPAAYMAGVKLQNITSELTSVASGQAGQTAGLLLGWIAGGNYNLDTLELSSGNAQALVGKVTQPAQTQQTMVQFWKTNFNTLLTGHQLQYAFIDQFDAGVGYYYYHYTDEEKYKFELNYVDGKVERPQKEAVSGVQAVGKNDENFYINPMVEGLTDGYGTEEYPYLISSAKQLYAIAMALKTYNAAALTTLIPNLTMLKTPEEGEPYEVMAINNGAFNGYDAVAILEHLRTAYYRQVSDIDMTTYDVTKEDGDVQDQMGSVYVGIGTYQHPFKGNFDGRGYELILKDHGLFGYLDGAVIRNLHLKTLTNKTLTITAQSQPAVSYHGAVADVVLGGDNFISNIKLETRFDVISAEGHNVYVGGFIAFVEAGTVIISNQMADFAKELAIYEDGAQITSAHAKSGVYYAGVCPQVKDGYLIYEGDNVDQNTILSGFTLPQAQVNHEYLEDGKTISIVSEEAGAGWSFSTGKTAETTGLPLGMSLTAAGKLIGTPLEGGTFTIAVSATKAGAADGSGNNDLMDNQGGTYDYGIYTLTVLPDEAPQIQISQDTENALKQVFYGDEVVIRVTTPLYALAANPAANPPGEPGKAKYSGQREMQWKVTQGATLVDITRDENGVVTIKAEEAGQVTIALSYPGDKNYEPSKVEYISFTILSADITFKVDSYTFRQGAALPEGVGNLYLEGAETLVRDYQKEGYSVENLMDEDGRILISAMNEPDGDGEAAEFLNWLGISAPALTSRPRILCRTPFISRPPTTPLMPSTASTADTLRISLLANS